MRQSLALISFLIASQFSFEALSLKGAPKADRAPASACKSLYQSEHTHPNLPQRLRLGAATIQKYFDDVGNKIVVSIFTPIPDQNPQGLLVNMNARVFPRDSQKRFVIGDGSSRRSFTGVDLSPGSKLSKELAKILEDYYKSEYSKMTDGPEQFVKQKVRDYLGPTPEAGFDGRAEFPWDLQIAIKKDLNPFMKKAAAIEIFDFPVQTPVRHPITPLEKYLDVKKGYCLQVALLGSLILRELGVTHRLVNGAVVNEQSNSTFTTGGHTWLTLADGTVIDPTWRVMEKPNLQHATNPNWIRVAGSWRFENDNYPALELFDR